MVLVITMDLLFASVPALLVVLLCTSFVKLVTTFSILRVGLGLQGSGMAIVVVLVAGVFSLYLGAPLTTDLFRVGENPSGSAVYAACKPFFEAHTDSVLLSKVAKLREPLIASGVGGVSNTNQVAMTDALLPAFLLTELREALVIGVYLLVPFVVVDVLLAVICACGAMSQLAMGSLALPLKLLLFFAVDGWTLVTTRILKGYALTG